MAGHGHWMPFYWADYFADTTHLTTEEHGAYMLLLGAYWRRGEPLPDDSSYLASASKMTERRFKLVANKLSEFFVILGGLWYHSRVEFELLKSCDRISAGKAGAHARWHAVALPPTTTPTKEGLNLSLVGKKNGGGNGVTVPDPANRLAIFQRNLAESIGKELRSTEQGWLIVGRAADPALPGHGEALSFCKTHAKEKLQKGWPHQWPK